MFQHGIVFDMFRNGLFQIADIGNSLNPNIKGEAYFNSPDSQKLNDRCAQVFLPLAFPVITMARAAVYAESGGPTILELERVGKYGNFNQYKLRTMRTGSEREVGRALLSPHGGFFIPDEYDEPYNNVRYKTQESEPDQGPIHIKLPNDPRITKVGKVMRKLSVDELVQIYNVKNRTMRFFGNRPKAPEEYARYCKRFPRYSGNYTICEPGITGLEQVYGRADLTPEQIDEYTAEYAEEGCLKLDLKIFWLTVGAVLSRKGAY